MLTKKIVAFALASALALTSVAAPNVADAKKAQVVYDPTDSVNNGVYIDTSLVPTSNPSDIKVENGVVVAKRNVNFQLHCSVDCRWEVEAQGDSNRDSVSNGLISVDRSGLVRIDKNTKGGNYTVKAIAENVSNDKTATIEIKVKGDEDAAKVKSISYDKNAIENPAQMRVSDDEKTLYIDGYVYREEIPVKFSPTYINDTEITFEEAQSQVYELSDSRRANRNNSRITTKAKTGSEASTIQCTVGKDSTKFTNQDLKLVVNELKRVDSIETTEKEAANRTYNMSKNQHASFNFVTNGDITLPHDGVEKVEFSLNQDGVAIDPSYSSSTVTRYDINDVDGKKFATVTINTSGPNNTYVTVDTEEKGEFKSVPAVTVNYTVHGDTDNAGTSYSKDFTLKFNTDVTASFTEALLDFEADDFILDRSYTVKKEVLGDKETDVYYFESNGRNLNLANATVANVPNVRSFFTSKTLSFDSQDATYKIKYELKDLDNEVFGSAAVAKKFNNAVIGEGEVGTDSVLKDNSKLTLKGIGYKKIVVQCTKGTDIISKKEYVIRLVSSSAAIEDLNEYKISKNADTWYALSEGEVVHIRKGEAVLPGFYKKDGTRYVAADNIGKDNPYIEYEISDKNVANATLDSSVNQFKICGQNAGIVTVTAYGTVNKANRQTFVLYVNKDVMTSTFSLGFDDAISSKMVNSDYVIDGKQKNVPINARSNMQNAGVPQNLKWSISDTTGEFATIDPTTGAITTKKYSDEPITVTAVDAAGNKATITFTIKKVEATAVTALGLKESDTDFERTSDTSGKCKVGNKFALKVEKYEPINATDVLGKSKWTSTDESVVKVDSNGVVTAVGEGQAKIVLAYTAGGRTTETDYTITVSGHATTVTSILANDIALTRIGDTRTIATTVLPANAVDKSVTYTSSDESIVTVSPSGVVTGNAVGKATITIKSVANPNVVAKITVTVGGQSDLNPSDPAATVAPAPSSAKADSNKVAATKIKSAKNKKGKKIVIKLKKVKGAKYQVTYSLNKKFRKAKSKKASKPTITLKKLKKKNVYFIKARTYKKINGKTVYSKYTKVKKVKVKK
ncbi:Ig-like domain-containing protein [Eubacterium xylanophilum]|uniref:Ig-like domain-containing protein n=1 Tax=Eubacterium xylanophilum TaxID=39497 RepID=UPI0004B35CB0|nr:Ig-like domain-containing protein [Eubacterium xylanophilum]